VPKEGTNRKFLDFKELIFITMVEEKRAKIGPVVKVPIREIVKVSEPIESLNAPHTVIK
jgi:hypothetical protein